ncbi:MAG: hypothetical protein MJD61_00340 [Proteobacteria bacterium]|nr:hypothetical protein [Pseudomonadota bacterium]
MDRVAAVIHPQHVPIAGALITLALLGCGQHPLALSGRADVITVRVAEGDYRDLSVGVSTTKGLYVAARRRSDAALTVIQAEPFSECVVGKTLWHGTLFVEDQAKLMMLQAGTNASDAALRFADTDCRVDDLSVLRVAPPFNVWGTQKASEFTFSMHTVDGDLVFVKPFEGKKSPIASGTWDSQRSKHGLWVGEGQELVLRDDDGKELIRTGKAVKRFALEARNKEVAYEDGNVIERAEITNQQLDKLQRVDTGCEMRFMARGPRSELAYYAPCDKDRKHTPESKLIVQHLAEGRREYAANIRSYRHFFDANLVQNIVYQLASQELWLDGPALPQPVRIGGNAPLGNVFSNPAKSALFALVDRVAQQSEEVYAGRLIRFTPEGSVTLAEGLESFKLLPSRTRHVPGNVTKIPSTFKMAALWFQKPLPPPAGSSKRKELYDVAVVDARALDEGRVRPLLEPRSVPANGMRYVWGAEVPAVAYLDKWQFEDDAPGGPDHGRLNVWLQDTNEHFVIDEHVSEFMPVSAPQRGLLYTVTDPKRNGIWFALLHKPCATPLECYL